MTKNLVEYSAYTICEQKDTVLYTGYCVVHILPGTVDSYLLQ